MKIAALIVTRGRPQQVVGIIESMRMLATGEHELEFLVACDDDDPMDTAAIIRQWRTYGSAQTIDVDIGPRPIGPGSCWNRLAKLTDADVLVTLTDDGIVCTPMWDGCINWAWRNHDWAHADLKIGGLRDLANPGQPTLFAMSPTWVRHTGHVFDARYPFWFSDTAIAETYSFVTGTGVPCLPIDFASKAGQWNPRLRHMDLWWTHYGLTRRERLSVASDIRQALGLPVPANLGTTHALWQKRDSEGLPASEEIVRQLRNPAPLDARYLEAERAAIGYVAEHSGRVFQPSTNVRSERMFSDRADT